MAVLTNRSVTVAATEDTGAPVDLQVSELVGVITDADLGTAVSLTFEGSASPDGPWVPVTEEVLGDDVTWVVAPSTAVAAANPIGTPRFVRPVLDSPPSADTVLVFQLRDTSGS